jgi:hypothetical protein
MGEANITRGRDDINSGFLSKNHKDERAHVEDRDTDGRAILKCILNMGEYELDPTEDRGPVTDPCDLDNEPSSSITAWNFITV